MLERDITTGGLLDLMKRRRSIRRYTTQQIPRADLDRIIEAGTFAPNAGGGQRSVLVGVHNAELVEQIGKLNVGVYGSQLPGGQPRVG